MGNIKSQKLKDYIVQSGMSETEWAKQHGFPQKTINCWINGTRNALLKNAKKLAECCHCKISDISDFVMDDETEDDLEERIVFIRSLTEAEYSELVNAYENGTLDLFQIAKLDDIENFRERAIMQIARLDISPEAKGKVIDILSKLAQA